MTVVVFARKEPENNCHRQDTFTRTFNAALLVSQLVYAIFTTCLEEKYNHLIYRNYRHIALVQVVIKVV